MGYHIQCDPETSEAQEPQPCNPENAWPGFCMQDLGQRFYNPGMGRWPSRDPIGERGGLNLQVFCGNAPSRKIDPLGLRPCVLRPMVTVEYGSLEWRVFVDIGALRRNTVAGFYGDPITIGNPKVRATCGLWRNKVKVEPVLSDCGGVILIVVGDGGTSPFQFREEHELRHWRYHTESYAEVATAVDQVQGRCVCPTCYDAIQAWLTAVVDAAGYRKKRNDASNDCLDYPVGMPERQQQCAAVGRWHARHVEATEQKEKARKAMEESCP